MDSDPLGVFFATTDTGGEKLLFKYPYESEESAEKPSFITSFPSNSYNLKPSLVSKYTVCKENCLSNIKNNIVIGFDDDVLANILVSAKNNLSCRRYYLKVNDVIFAGYTHKLNTNQKGQSESESKTIYFTIAFALKPFTESMLIGQFQDLCHQLCASLIHEEKRCSFLSEQKIKFLKYHDSENAHEKISLDVSFGVFLKQLYQSISDYGYVDAYLNKWIRISYCLNPKVSENYSNKKMLIFKTPNLIQNYLKAIMPYHSLLLLEDEQILLNKLINESSPALVKILRNCQPGKSIQTLSAESDIAISQVRLLVHALVTWGLAMVVYPFSPSNIYLISPKANISATDVFSFSQEFKGLNIKSILALFSLPLQLRDHRNSFIKQYRGLPEQQQIISWLLRRHLIYQVHTYVFYMVNIIKQRISGSQENKNLLYRPNSSNDSNYSLHNQPIFSMVYRDDQLGNSLNSSILSGKSYEEIYSNGEGTSSDHNQSQMSWKSHDSIANSNSGDVFNTANDFEDECFLRLCKEYFNGKHHLEDVMYREHMPRSQICSLIDKYRMKLALCSHEEAEISYWVSAS